MTNLDFVTGEVSIAPIPQGDCDTSQCAEFIVNTARKHPTVKEREELECALSNICLPRVGCHMGSSELDSLVERMQNA